MSVFEDPVLTGHRVISEERGKQITKLKAEIRAWEQAYNRLYWQYQDMRKAVDGVAAQERPKRPKEVKDELEEGLGGKRRG